MEELACLTIEKCHRQVTNDYGVLYQWLRRGEKRNDDNNKAGEGALGRKYRKKPTG